MTQRSSDAATRSTADDELAAKVAFLRRPASYPEHPSAIEWVETHFAFVFLGDRLVYKLKKPVKYGQVDYTTRSARRAACELELALNRRLAPRVYLGVVPLTRDDAGRLALDGAGETVDWLVKMRRLPRERTLERLASNVAPESAALRALLAKLIAFYRRAAVPPWSAADYLARLERTTSAELDALADAALGLDGARLEALRTALHRCLASHATAFSDRMRDRRVVDAHGDLRPEHVFLIDGEPEIIDCLEFSQELRWLDAAEEIAFLSLECERIGAAGTGRRILELYREMASDPIAREVLAFYRARRALSRAVLAAWRSLEERDGRRIGWQERVEWYLRAAEAALR